MAVSFHGRWSEILSALIPQVPLPTGIPKHQPCCINGHSGSRDGFRFFKDWEAQGGGICNTCGPFPNGVKLVAGVLGIDEKEAFKQIAQVIEESDGSTTTKSNFVRYEPQDYSPTELSAEEKAKRQKSIERVIKWSKPIANSPANLYLQNRGLNSIPFDVYFNNSMIYTDDDAEMMKLPAMVSLFRNPQGEVITIHRTYISNDGKKANVAKAKKVMSGTETLTGGAIRLFPLDEMKKLGVAEGIETAIAAKEITGIPTWACYSSTVLAGFEPPPEINELFVFADYDLNGAGQNAAAKLVERLSESRPDLKVTVFLPPSNGEKMDWLDWLVSQRYEQLP